MHNLHGEVKVMYEKIKLKGFQKWKDDSDEETSPTETKYNNVLTDSNSKGTAINSGETHANVISDVEMKNVHNLQNKTNRQPDIRNLRRSSSSTNPKDSVPEKKGKRKNNTSKK